jgi:hypothetical protein
MRVSVCLCVYVKEEWGGRGRRGQTQDIKCKYLAVVAGNARDYVKMYVRHLCPRERAEEDTMAGG